LYDTVAVPFIKFITLYSILIEKAAQILWGKLPYKINLKDDKNLEIFKNASRLLILSKTSCLRERLLKYHANSAIKETE